MTEQLSLWSLVSGASLLVQAVMALLFIASMVSWVMIIQRGLFLKNASNQFRRFEDRFWSGIDLNQLYREAGKNDFSDGGASSIFATGFREFNRQTKQGGANADITMEAAERAMRVALSREEEKLNTHLPFLASVASVSPYIGLFGTVWGIMNSFRGLANVQQATLAVVAPGISEALIATAMGLFAAIPAVLAYNRYSASADNILSNYQTFAEEFSSILHRQIHSD